VIFGSHVDFPVEAGATDRYSTTDGPVISSLKGSWQSVILSCGDE
jgi:hypothetical protein